MIAAFSLVAALFSANSVSWDGGGPEPAFAYPATAKNLEPGHSKGTIAHKSGNTRALSAETTSGSSSFACEWWGGRVMPAWTNYMSMDALGFCDNSYTLNFNSTLTAQWGSNTKTKSSSLSATEWVDRSPWWGTVAVGQQVTWTWDVTMTTYAPDTWSSINDPSHCAIQTNNQIVICHYTGVVVPFPVFGTSTPTATPFPTVVTASPNCPWIGDAADYGWAKVPPTNDVMEELSAIVAFNYRATHQFKRIERTVHWTNNTTYLPDGVTHPSGFQGPQEVLPLEPEDTYVIWPSQINGVGRGFISWATRVDVDFWNGDRCVWWSNFSMQN